MLRKEQYFLLSLDVAYNEFKEQYEKSLHSINDEKERMLLMFRTTALIHLILDIYEKQRLSDVVDASEKGLFVGLRHANNKLKHDIQIFAVEQLQGGFSFPISFPFSCEPFSFAFCGLGTDNSHIDNSTAYTRYLKGKDAKQTLEKIISIIRLHISQQNSNQS